MARKGLLMVVSGPSGAGKGTLCQELLERSVGLEFSVSVTTRPPRLGEVDGVHYSFWSEERFLEAVTRSYFLEWARVYGRHYGTPVEQVVPRLERGVDVLLDLDIEGARQVKDRIPDAVSVFILPPSLEALAERISRRGSESAEESRLRLKAAVGVLEAAVEFDYLILNDCLTEAVRTLEAILTAERWRVSRRGGLMREFLVPRAPAEKGTDTNG